MKNIRKDSGFSLVELMVVVAIISVLLAITIPNMGRWINDNHLKGAARDIVANMQWAKMSAIKENQDWTMVFDVTNKKYTINTGYVDTANPGTIQKEVLLTDYKGGVGYGHGDAAKPIGDTFSDNNVTYLGNRLNFTSKGLVNKVGYVYLENEQKTAYGVGTGALAGSISIRKWVGTDWDPPAD
ncbi:Prepilin-type N-terminal cleavage/methylation domain-containing protein [Desulfonema limicola]|uniref:Prepilin-type N-terminal cleavage/methylation domain-containing protein n=1 Tax=Desulfonema limicola TaxID=45656 RepID=A0A975BC17_9BACT|nr:prepilin-type N-terminal cleavage/methylation domain-containing protein [Desulfonema limicola]QTA82657.1 Prepilin-type N-terminal cleavage/methylation domain-containing protein [Desulfonema limicola]